MSRKHLNCICLDPSKNCEEAFDWYVDNYHHHDDVVGLLHVHQMPDIPITGTADNPLSICNDSHKIVIHSFDVSLKLIKKFKEKCQSLNIEYIVLTSDTHHVSTGHSICDLAKKYHADAIIMGQRGVNKIRRMLLGSTSDYVVHHAHIPVTVVPTGDAFHHP